MFCEVEKCNEAYEEISAGIISYFSKERNCKSENFIKACEYYVTHMAQ